MDPGFRRGDEERSFSMGCSACVRVDVTPQERRLKSCTYRPWVCPLAGFGAKPP